MMTVGMEATNGGVMRAAVRAEDQSTRHTPRRSLRRDVAAGSTLEDRSIIRYMLDLNRYLRAARRLSAAMKKHGILWTLEKSLAHLRIRLDQRRARREKLHRAGRIRSKRLARSYIWSERLVDDIGVVPSVRPINEHDYSFSIPFKVPVRHGVERVAVIAHIFYIEYAEEIQSHLANIEVPADLFVSTDTAEKKVALEQIFQAYSNGAVEIRLMQNKGRDIAPKLVGFADVYARYEYFLHIHSKRSPHGGDGLKDWRAYLYGHLVGSPEIVHSNLALLSYENIGMVFPQHFFPLRGVLNWGYDFNFAKSILARAGVELRKDNLLEFPSGSMFWARSAALQKLLALELQWDDFEDEAGKIDGTLAHAIERSYLFFVEATGFRWAKVALPKGYPLKGTLIQVAQAADIENGLEHVFNPVLSRPLLRPSAMERLTPETRRLLVRRSDNPKPRINLLIPTVNPAQVFGGVSTALKVFAATGDQLGLDFDVRIIVTDAAVELQSLAALTGYEIDMLDRHSDLKNRVLTDVASRDAPLYLRRSDFFFASAWWNAAQAFDLQKQQLQFFSQKMPFTYLVQDFEPNFSSWSSEWAAAESTYSQARESIAIINSNELFDYMNARYVFGKTYLLPYSPNAAIVDALKSVQRKKQILVYGRPSVGRNCFELLMDGLATWQARCPMEAAEWKIISVGEAYDDVQCSPAQNVTVLGKVDLPSYGQLLSDSAIGISLMLSPHPSYPPLEMAQAGLITITNAFEKKDLRAYSDAILNIPRLQPEALADVLEQATTRWSEARFPAAIKGGADLRLPEPSGPVLDYKALASTLRDALS